MKKLIYIAGLGHSGSTILDMSMGSHPFITGLGEIISLLKRSPAELEKIYRQDVCSCGTKMQQCMFWSRAKPVLQQEGRSREEKYRELMLLFSRVFPDQIPLDSSKYLYKTLKTLNREYDLKVIYLVRDFRSWIYSRYLRYRNPMIYYGYYWYALNQRIKWLLDHWNIEYMSMGYEELCFYPKEMLHKISEFLGIAYTGEMLHPAKSGSHIVSGNIARADEVKREKFIYDARWLTSGRLNAIQPLLFPLYKWNKKQVYGHFMGDKNKAFNKSNYDFLIFSDQRKEHLLNELEGQ